MKSEENITDILNNYKAYLKLEKSLSLHTFDAYMRDLSKLSEFLKEENISLLEAKLEHLETFSAKLRDLGICPSSQARILSGIRSFYHFLILSNILETDPSELLESPQTGFKIPEGAQYVEPEIYTPAGYTLVWRDEFNDPSLIMPDTKEWWYETAEPGWVNNELQTYVAGRTGDIITADVSDGTLKIRAIKSGSRVYSARVNTRKNWTYGYFEARLKLPKGKGTWPAFWMMPSVWSGWPEGGEVDIMEHVGCVPTEVSSSIHCKSYYHAIGTQKTAARKIAGVMDEFHTYALEWTPEYIKTYVDGKQLFYYNPDDYSQGRNANTWPFNKPFELKLNLAWGGDWGGMMGVDESCLPATYEIDYVRVFQK